jgi:hypothetical protein
MGVVCRYNIYAEPPPGQFEEFNTTAATLIAGWADCEAELDARKKNR